MRTVPTKCYPTKLVKMAWNVCKASTAPTHNATGSDQLEEESANLIYRKVRSSDGILPNSRTYVESLKPTVNDYLHLLDIIHYELKYDR